MGEPSSEDPLGQDPDDLHNEHWQYLPVNNLPLDIRCEPDIRGPRTGIDLQPKEIFAVSQKVPSGDVTYLKMADGRGWVFDRTEKGVMCKLLRASLAQQRAALENNSVVAAAFQRRQ